jgi:hypothetical protein
LSSDERVSPANGIWLCQNCAKLIDSDVAQFKIEELQRWKVDREAEARRQIGRATPDQSARDLIVELHVGELVEANVGTTRRFLFKVANPSERPTTVWGAGVDAPDFGISAPAFDPMLLVYPPQFAFPREVTDGQGFAFHSSIDYFESQLLSKNIAPPIQVIGYVTDALGNRHESKPTTYSRDRIAG